MICGATSGAGKSTVSTALCRAWARRGRSVAPFKAQNMSNHAAVTADGGEVGRSQAMQADAARVPLDRRMNPILLKPHSAGGNHLVVLGDEVTPADARSRDGTTSDDLRAVVLDALGSLRGDHDWVVAEGAGGAAEINLLDRDLVNLPLARAAGLPAILVVDIEPGGAFAAAHGTIDLLPDDLRAPIAGIVFNKFRGDTRLLDPGIEVLERRSGVPVLGTLPAIDDHLALGVEDSLDVHASSRPAGRSERPVRIAAVRLPHLANPSDLDPFLVEPDVELRWITRADEIAGADLIVVPGSRATVADLGWLRERGIDSALLRSSARIVGLCAGYQMLGTMIHDDIESGAGSVPALGLLDVETTFEQPKIVRRSSGSCGDHRLHGYQIRFGRPEGAPASWLVVDGRPEGATGHGGAISGTSLHGVFDADDFRTDLLASVAEAAGRVYERAPAGFAEQLDAHHDRLADWLEAALPVDRLTEIASTASTHGAAPGW